MRPSYLNKSNEKAFNIMLQLVKEKSATCKISIAWIMWKFKVDMQYAKRLMEGIS